MNKEQRILLLIAATLFLIILFGTAIAFISGNAKPGEGLRKKDPSPESLTKETANKTAVFSQIGILRCSTADEPPIPVVISLYFPYPADDRPFYEELSKKTQKLRILITDYIASYTSAELLNAGEQAIKENLVDIINTELVLGEIEFLYFAEYIFLE